MKPWLIVSLVALLAVAAAVVFVGGGLPATQSDFQVVQLVDLKKSRGYAVADQGVWFADGNDLFYLDLAQSTAPPRQIRRFDTPIYVQCVAESGDTLVLSRQNLLEIYDVRVTDRPTLIAGFDPPGNPPSHCALRGNVLAFDSYGGGIDSQHVHIYDVSGTGEPVLLSTVVTEQGATIYDIAVTDSLVLLANGWDGLTIIGKGNDQKYGIISRLKPGGYVRGVHPAGNRAYLAVSDAPNIRSKFVIADISNPTSPRTIASVDTSGGAQDVYAVKHLAFVADHQNGLLAFDISEETRPVVVAHHRCWCSNLSGTGRSLVLTAKTNGSETSLEVLALKAR